MSKKTYKEIGDTGIHQVVEPMFHVTVNGIIFGLMAMAIIGQFGLIIYLMNLIVDLA